jgi:hypothetical protein
MFSADGIFRRSKTGSLVIEDEKGFPCIEIKSGYGGRYERITEVLEG